MHDQVDTRHVRCCDDTTYVLQLYHTPRTRVTESSGVDSVTARCAGSHTSRPAISSVTLVPSAGGGLTGPMAVMAIAEKSAVLTSNNNTTSTNNNNIIIIINNNIQIHTTTPTCCTHELKHANPPATTIQHRCTVPPHDVTSGHRYTP